MAHGLAESAVPAASAVRIETTSGRVLSGVIDNRTDNHSLWLRREDDKIVLATPVAWSQVASAAVAGESIDAGTLQARADELASSGGQPLIAQGAVPATAAKTIGMSSRGRKVRVRNLEIVCAALANVDRDVEPDGIEVGIVAVGHDGRPLAVRGTLRAGLYGERRPLYEPEAQFGELDRWTQRVRPEDSVDGVATYYLPFRATAPEWEFELLPDAVITVQLGANGHGNFAASAPVVIREFNPLRDNLQQDRGQRFLPTEVQGTRPLSTFGPQHGLWLHWTR